MIINSKNNVIGIQDLSSIIISSSTSEYASRASVPRLHKKTPSPRGSPRNGSVSGMGSGSRSGSSPFMSPRKGSESGQGSSLGTPKETERERNRILDMEGGIDGITINNDGSGKKMR